MPADGEIEPRLGMTDDDPAEVRQYDAASGTWSEWIEEGDFRRRIKGHPRYAEWSKEIREKIKAERERRTEAEALAPRIVAEPREAQAAPAGEDLTLLEKRDRLRAYLQQHPGTRIMDLELHQDAERGPLFILAKKLLQRGELLEHPKTRALMIKGEQLPAGEITVLIRQDLPMIRDSEGRDRKLARGDLITLPDSTARALITKGLAEEAWVPRPAPEDVSLAAPEASAGIEDTSQADHETEAELAGDGATNGELDRPPLPAETLPEQPGAEAMLDRPHPDSLEGAAARLEFTRRCKEEERRVAAAHKRPIKLHEIRRDAAGELLISAEIDGECREWRYDALEAEFTDHAENYPLMALEMLQYKKRAFLEPKGTSSARGTSKGNGTNEKRLRLPEGEIWAESVGDKTTIGFSTVRNAEIITRTVAEWKGIEPEFAKLIEEEYEYVKDVYNLPGRPDTEREDKSLLKDIIKVLDSFTDLPPGEGKSNGKDSPYRTSTAAHIICSAFYDMVAVRPGLLPVAETKTGKTRLITINALISYRGFSIGAPTEAVVLRALGSYHVTLCIDECSDTAEVLPLILTIYKLSFDGQNIARCDLYDQRRIITYPCKGFVTLSLKSLDKVPEDSINRGVVVHLGYKTRDLEFLEPSHPKFAPLFKDLRTRVAALRLRALAGRIDVPGALDRAGELARRKYSFGNKEYELDSRDFTKAQTLLLPVVLMGENERQVKDVMEVMLRSKIEGEDAQGQSFAAKCWQALYDEVVTLWSGAGGPKLDKDGVPVPMKGREITTKMIADTVRENLKNEGELLKDEDLKTRSVTEALRSLLFEFEPGAQRASYLVTDRPSFSMGWRNCVRKYGEPKGNAYEVNKGA